MNTARNGKIAHLPYEVREQVNRYIRAGQPGNALLDILNGLPEVREMLDKEFDGELITKQNLSAWRLGGYAEWEARQVLLTDAKDLHKYGLDLEKQGSAQMVERLTTVMVGKLGSLALKWDGRPDEECEAQLASLGKLSRFVVMLQRGVDRSARVQMAREKHQWDEARFTQQLGGWIAEQKVAEVAREEVAPVMLESVKTLMHNVGLDYDWLKAKAAKRKEREAGVKSEGLNQKSEGMTKPEGSGAHPATAGRPTKGNPHPGPLPSDGRGGAIGPATAKVASSETSNIEGEELGEKADLEVVEAQEAARPVKVGQGFEKSNERLSPSDAEREKAREDGDLRSDAPRSDTDDKGGAVQWN